MHIIWDISLSNYIIITKISNARVRGCTNTLTIGPHLSTSHNVDSLILIQTRKASSKNLRFSVLKRKIPFFL